MGSVLMKLTNGNLIPQQHIPPIMPNYPPETANGHDYIYRVKFSFTSSRRIGCGAFVVWEGLSLSNLAAKGQDFDVLKANLTCVYGFINLGWRAVERTAWRWEGTDGRLPSRLAPLRSMCFILYDHKWGLKRTSPWAMYISGGLQLHRSWLVTGRVAGSICCVTDCRPQNARPVKNVSY